MSDEQNGEQDAELGFDVGALLESAQQMQEQLLAAQAQAAETVVDGSAGGGMVTVTVTGGLEFQRVEISPEVIDPSDPEMLQDLVLAALHDAVAKVNAMQQASMGAMAAPGGEGFDVGGLDLGGLDLGGMLGAGPEADSE